MFTHYNIESEKIITLIKNNITNEIDSEAYQRCSSMVNWEN